MMYLQSFWLDIRFQLSDAHIVTGSPACVSIFAIIMAIPASGMEAETDQRNGSALSLRDSGNNAFKKGHVESALSFYGQAVLQDPQDYRSFSNQSQCYAELGKWESSAIAAKKCIACEPHFDKGHGTQTYTYTHSIPASDQTAAVCTECISCFDGQNTGSLCTMHIEHFPLNKDKHDTRKTCTQRNCLV